MGWVPGAAVAAPALALGLQLAWSRGPGPAPVASVPLAVPRGHCSGSAGWRSPAPGSALGPAVPP
eukprot:3784903-Alexandrium_andersonii.AAC.1